MEGWGLQPLVPVYTVLMTGFSFSAWSLRKNSSREEIYNNGETTGRGGSLMAFTRIVPEIGTRGKDVTLWGVFLVLSLLLFAGCTLSVRVRIGETVSVCVGRGIELEGGDFSLFFRDVLEDSRCPQGVECFWEGRVVALFDVQGNATGVELVESRLPKTLPFGSYCVVFLGVFPPRTSLTPPAKDEYRVVLRIEKCTLESPGLEVPGTPSGLPANLSSKGTFSSPQIFPKNFFLPP